jgi:hypothetical protein
MWCCWIFPANNPAASHGGRRTPVRDRPGCDLNPTVYLPLYLVKSKVVVNVPVS